MLNKISKVQKMASLDAMRILRDSGYTVKRAGLNFRVITPTGSNSYMTTLELSDTATKIKQVIL